MKNKNLLELEKTSEYFIWIDDQAGFNEEDLFYTEYYNNGNGVLVLREALEPNEEQSIPWLRNKMGVIKKDLYLQTHEEIK